MAEKKNYFEELNAIDLKEKIKQKNGLTYLSWSSAWGAIKKIHPDATFEVREMIIDDRGNKRFWFDDGRTGWVEVSVTINGIEITESLAIMDFRNKAIPADTITSVDANKAMKRCLVKACALHGLGLYIYEGEDLPEEVSDIIDKQKKCIDLIKKKCAISEKAKEKVAEICKKADPEAEGDPRLINDADVLDSILKQLKAIR